MSGSVRIGTSGWHYKHWLGTFYPPDLPAGRMLELYARAFDTVELNNTFYRLPTESAVEQWRGTTPDGFCFAVKGSRYLTHMKKLKDAGPGLDKFLAPVRLLGDKLGPIVFQLPPRWRCDAERLEAFLGELPRDHRFAFELRDASWHTPEVYALLRAYGAGFCVYDISGFRSPAEVTADFAYVRLHGPTEHAYRGGYSDEAIAEWAGRVAAWRRTLDAVYVYFDNDDAGHAPRDALRLRELVG